jgi:hypothetical protein
MAEIKRVSAREFLRNINAIHEPVEVYKRDALKGTWYPSMTSTWMMTTSAVLAPATDVIGEPKPKTRKKRPS